MFCSNCGEKIRFKKICKKCGYKLGKENNYCVYCENTINKDAELCLNCGQKKYRNKLNFVLYILFLIFSFITLFGIYSYLNEKTVSNLIIVIGFLILALNFLPIWKDTIKVKFAKNKVLRKILILTKSIFVPMIALILIVYGSVISPFSWTAEEASNYARETYFSTHLKNPESLQIHDYKVTYSNKVVDDNITIWVKYDYSAQNGLGGYNRDNITITLLYNTNTGTFSFVSAK